MRESRLQMCRFGIENERERDPVDEHCSEISTLLTFSFLWSQSALAGVPRLGDMPPDSVLTVHSSIHLEFQIA